MRPFRFHPAAEAEYEAATAWYAARTAVAADFVAEVERAIDFMREFPEASQRWPGLEEVRRHVMANFPFLVVYATELDGLLILAIAHAKRRPGYWVQRLAQRHRRRH